MTANEFYKQYGQHLCRVQNQQEEKLYKPRGKDLGAGYTDYISKLVRNQSPLLIEEDKFKFCGRYLLPSYLSIVYWWERCIAYIPITVNTAAFSLEFSGCFMAKLEIGGSWYAFHIHADEKQEYNRKRLFAQFVQLNHVGNKLTLFQPNSHEGIKSDQIKQRNTSLQICGLIDSGGICYSILLDTKTYQAIRIEQMNSVYLDSLLY